MSKKRFTFVMEQGLGHVTFTQNLQQTFAGEEETEIEWLPIEFARQNWVENLPLLRNNWSFRGSLKARRAINASHKKKGASDLYFIHTQVISLLSSGWLNKRIPIVISLDATGKNYDEVGLAYGHTTHASPLESFKLWLNRHSLTKATRIVAWSNWTRQSLIDDYKVAAAKIEVIPPGTDLSYWENQQRTEKLAEKPNLLFVGGDFERKGGQLLLDCFRRELADKAELHLVTKAQVQAGDGVFVHHNVTPHSPELQNLFRQADLFILPTQGDCMPHAILEAMAAGLPVITTNVGAISEMVVPGHNGLLIKPGDGPALAQASQQLLANPVLRRQMGLNGRKLAETKFDATKNSLRILDLCKAVVVG